MDFALRPLSLSSLSPPLPPLRSSLKAMACFLAIISSFKTLRFACRRCPVPPLNQPGSGVVEETAAERSRSSIRRLAQRRLRRPAERSYSSIRRLHGVQRRGGSPPERSRSSFRRLST
jgi:hypothetical protein